MKTQNPITTLSAIPAVLMVAATAWISPNAHGQDLVLEEVVVTARKREENLQETPLAVSAYTGRALAESGIDSIDDLNNIVPGVDLKGGNGVTGKANIFIRGVGQRNTGVNIDSGVGIYLDGIYLSRADGALLDVNDVASIQVLRGPQGTLFGKNTTAGAMLFNTNRPSDDFEASAMVRAGNFDRLDGSAVLNLPLTDTLFTRLSLTSIKRDGFMNNLTTGVKHNDEDRIAGVWQLRWLPSDDVAIDLNAIYTKTNQNSRGQKCQPVPGIDGWQAPGFNQLLANSTTPGTIDELCDVSVNAGDYDWTGDVGRSTLYQAETTGFSVTADWSISDNLSVKSITGWRESIGADANDLDPTSATLLYQSTYEHPAAVPTKTHQITQEIQFTGEAMGGKLSYVTGAFYFAEETDERALISEVASAEIAQAPGTIFAINSQRTELLADNTAWAVFSQLDWNITDSWRLTVGGRYTSEDRELYRARAELDPSTLTTAEGPVIDVGAFILPEANSFNRGWGFFEPNITTDKVSASDFTPMASLQYLFEGTGFINSGTAYFTYSEGFLSGGLSEAPTVIPDANGNPTLDANGNTIPGPFNEFEPEEVTNYELGIKLDAWDQRLRLNAAAFYADYDNRQLTTIVINRTLGSPAGATFNAKTSSISGLELETTVLPFGQLEITFNAAFYKGEIDEYEDTRLNLVEVPAGLDCIADGVGDVMVGAACVTETLIDRSDEDLVRLPAQTVYLAAQYRFIGDYGTIVPRIQYSKKFDIEHCFERGSCESGLWKGDETDLSARLTWYSPEENYRISAYGSNLTDEIYVIGGQPLVDSFGFGGVTFNPPRMYGVELEARW